MTEFSQKAAGIGMRPSEVKNSSETSNILRGVYPCDDQRTPSVKTNEINKNK